MSISFVGCVNTGTSIYRKVEASRKCFPVKLFVFKFHETYFFLAHFDLFDNANVPSRAKGNSLGIDFI